MEWIFGLWVYTLSVQDKFHFLKSGRNTCGSNILFLKPQVTWAANIQTYNILVPQEKSNK